MAAIGSSLTDPFDEDVDHAVDQAVRLHKRESGVGYQQRRDAVDARPKRLCRLVDVLAVQQARFDTASDPCAEAVEAVPSGATIDRIRAHDLGVALNERNDIVVRVFHCKIDINAQAAAKTVERRRWVLIDAFEFARQPRESLLADALQDFTLSRK